MSKAQTGIVRYRGRGEQPFRFRVIAKNGEIVAPIEGYATPAGRDEGIIALTRALVSEASVELMAELGYVPRGTAPRHSKLRTRDSGPTTTNCDTPV